MVDMTSLTVTFDDFVTNPLFVDDLFQKAYVLWMMFLRYLLVVMD